MNQEKIGKFISECRRNKKITQSQLAEKLGVTDKSVSKWETGKCMPDLSLFSPLCEILDITINDLMAGEKIDKKEYQYKFEQNIINVASIINNKYSFIKKIILLIISILVFVILLFVFFSNYQVTLNYNENKMFIEERNHSIVFTTKDLCTVYSGNINQYSLILEGKEYGIIFINSKCSYNEIIEYSLNDGNSYRYVPITFINNFPKKYKIYYTNINLNKIKNSSRKKLNEYISNSILMYESE